MSRNTGNSNENKPARPATQPAAGQDGTNQPSAGDTQGDQTSDAIANGKNPEPSAAKPVDPHEVAARTESADRNIDARNEAEARTGAGNAAAAGTVRGAVDPADVGAQTAAAAIVPGAPILPIGPTIEQWVGAGYRPEHYPPDGFAERASAALTYYRETGRMPELPRAGTIEINAAHLVPMNNGASEMTDAAKMLLLDACDRFGVVPTTECRPKELLSWNYYGPKPQDGVPASVVIVTAGGVKLRHYDDPAYPMDGDTEEKLAIIFNAFRTDPDTKRPVRLPLPTDLALPLAAVTGIPTKQDHVFRRGYLKEGGKTEADRRARKR